MEVSSGPRPNGRPKVATTLEVGVRKRKVRYGPRRREVMRACRPTTRERPLGQVCNRVLVTPTPSPVLMRVVLALRRCVSLRPRDTTERVESLSPTTLISPIEAI